MLAKLTKEADKYILIETGSLDTTRNAWIVTLSLISDIQINESFDGCIFFTHSDYFFSDLRWCFIHQGSM